MVSGLLSEDFLLARTMTNMLDKLRPCWHALPDIFAYQILTKPLIASWIYLFGIITQALLRSTGRVAVTSGDFMFLFKTWQGYDCELVIEKVRRRRDENTKVASTIVEGSRLQPEERPEVEAENADENTEENTDEK